MHATLKYQCPQKNGQTVQCPVSIEAKQLTNKGGEGQAKIHWTNKDK